MALRLSSRLLIHWARECDHRYIVENYPSLERLLVPYRDPTLPERCISGLLLAWTGTTLAGGLFGLFGGIWNGLDRGDVALAPRNRLFKNPKNDYQRYINNSYQFLGANAILLAHIFTYSIGGMALGALFLPSCIVGMPIFLIKNSSVSGEEHCRSLIATSEELVN